MKTEHIPTSRINYRHLYAFWAVARQGHLTHAAELLHVSQSALSSQIHELEDRLERSLFLRTGRKLELTEEGRIVYDYAQAIFDLGSEMLATLDGSGQSLIQHLRLGSVATLSRNFQDNLIRPLLARENVQLTLESGSFEELLSKLRMHKLDVVLSNHAVAKDETNDWRCKRIARQAVSLIGQPEMGIRKFNFPRDLQGYKLVLPGPTSEIRTQFDTLCDEHGIKPTIFAEVDDMAMLRLLARDSGALAVLPAIVVQDEIQQGVLCELMRFSGLKESFFAITVPRRFEPPLLKTILQVMPIRL
jgi:LysR family transcriptional regulator, transcriptional activator of nhaA